MLSARWAGWRLCASFARRAATACVMAATAVPMFALLPATPAAATSALLVVGSATLTANDIALKQRLERYYTTTVRDDDEAADTAKNVIVISGSVDAAALGTKYKATARGVVVLAPPVLSSMAMAVTGAVGTLTGQTQIRINSGGSVLAGGFASGSLVSVYNDVETIGWATPVSTALKVAVVAAGTTTRVTIFRHLKGATMVGGYVAPGRRIGYYVQAAQALTGSGWLLFDNAVAQAANLTAVPPPLPPLPEPEVWPNPAWTTTSPANVGMDPTRTAEALSYGSSRGGSGIVVRRGRRVGFWGDQATRYDVKSTTKSFGSVILSLAIKDGLVRLDTLVQPSLRELGQPQNGPEALAWLSLITVRHLATHTSGFAKLGGFEPVLFEPGTEWLYSDGAPNWLADLLTVRYRQDLKQVMINRLLTPMGIAAGELVWRRNSYRPHTLLVNGVEVERREFGAGISTSVDVMAKFGLMLLRDGRWRDTRILPTGYASLAGTHQSQLTGLPCIDPNPRICPGATDHYGLLFWNNSDGHLPGVPTDAYWSAGLGTSFVLVIPSLDLLTARAGPAWTGPADQNVAAPYFALLAGAVNGASVMVSRRGRASSGSLP